MFFVLFGSGGVLGDDLSSVLLVFVLFFDSLVLVLFLLATERGTFLVWSFLHFVMFVDTIFRPFCDPFSSDAVFLDVSVLADDTDLADVSFLLLVTDVTDFSEVGIFLLLS